MKKAILAVSLGAGDAGAVQGCIRPVEDALRAAYPEYEVRRAFTSRIIVRRLRGQGIAVESEEEALARLRDEGFEEIIVVPTHIIPGHEYEKVCAAARGCAVAEPLLCCEDDLRWIAGILAEIAEAERRPLLMMGHGTDHAADEIYARLRESLHGNVFLACIEGEHTLEKRMPQLEALPERALTLMPLMLVAGAHAQRDLGGDGEDSWKSILEARGFDVRVRLQGLGALGQTAQRFVEKAGRAMASRENSSGSSA